MDHMTANEIRAKRREAEADEREALRWYDSHPSQEARWACESAAKSVRWWATVAAQTCGRGSSREDGR